MPAHSAGKHGVTGDRTSGPDELQLDPALNTKRLPGWVVPLLGIILALSAVVGGGYAAWRYNASKPQVVITAQASRTPWQLVPPLSMGEYSRDANADVSPTMNASKKQVVSATYSRSGAPTAVLVMSRPEEDAKKFMEDLGMNAVIAQGDGYCGTSTETNRDGCVVIRDNTAISVTDLAGASRDQLMALTVQFADQLSA